MRGRIAGGEKGRAPQSKGGFSSLTIVNHGRENFRLNSSKSPLTLRNFTLFLMYAEPNSQTSDRDCRNENTLTPTVDKISQTEVLVRPTRTCGCARLPADLFS